MKSFVSALLSCGVGLIFLSSDLHAACAVNKRVGSGWQPYPREELSSLIKRKEKHSKSGSFYMLKVEGEWYAVSQDCFRKTASPDQPQTAQATSHRNSNSRGSTTQMMHKDVRFELGYLGWGTNVKLAGGNEESISLSSTTLSVLGGLGKELPSGLKASGFGGLILGSTSAESKKGAQLTYKSSGGLALGVQAGFDLTRYFSETFYGGGDLRLRAMKFSLQQLPAGATQESSLSIFPSLGFLGGYRPKNSQNTFSARISLESTSLKPAFSIGAGIMLD